MERLENWWLEFESLVVPRTQNDRNNIMYLTNGFILLYLETPCHTLYDPPRTRARLPLYRQQNGRGGHNVIQRFFIFDFIKQFLMIINKNYLTGKMGRAQPVIPPNLYSVMLMNIIAFTGPRSACHSA